MPVRLALEDGPHEGVSRVDMKRRAGAILDALGIASSELSIVLTGDGPIQELNRIYRKKDKPTDVLAFAQREGALAHMAGRLLGDVIVSVPTAQRQARARGIDLVTEVTMLLAHGVLHLLGWDHETPGSDRRMRRETDRLVAAANSVAAAAMRQPRPARRSGTKEVIPPPAGHRRRTSSRRSGK